MYERKKKKTYNRTYKQELISKSTTGNNVLSIVLVDNNDYYFTCIDGIQKIIIDKNELIQNKINQVKSIAAYLNKKWNEMCDIRQKTVKTIQM